MAKVFDRVAWMESVATELRRKPAALRQAWGIQQRKPRERFLYGVRTPYGKKCSMASQQERVRQLVKYYEQHGVKQIEDGDDNWDWTKVDPNVCIYILSKVASQNTKLAKSVRDFLDGLLK